MNTTEMVASIERLRQLCQWHARIRKLEQKWATLHQVLVCPCRRCGRFEISEMYRSAHIEKYVANVATVDEARKLYQGVMRLRECQYNHECGCFNLPPALCNFIVGQFRFNCQQCRSESCVA